MLDITVPGTLSNLGPGYDTLGLAVSVLNRFEFNEGQGWSVNGAAVDPDTHLTLHTARRAAVRFGGSLDGLHVRQTERVPRSRGLGSSATARVAGMLAALHSLDLSPPLVEQLAFLSEEEGHPDNVVPALVGGLVVVDSGGPRVEHLRLKPPKMSVALCIPNREVSTEEARRILPETVAHDDAVFNQRRLAFLLVGLLEGRADAVGMGCADRLHQPWRSRLIGPVDEAFAAAKDAGALGSFISGSGSTLAAWVNDADPEAVARAMAEPFRASGVAAEALVVRPVARGALVSSAVG